MNIDFLQAALAERGAAIAVARFARGAAAGSAGHPDLASLLWAGEGVPRFAGLVIYPNVEVEAVEGPVFSSVFLPSAHRLASARPSPNQTSALPSDAATTHIPTNGHPSPSPFLPPLRLKAMGYLSSAEVAVLWDFQARSGVRTVKFAAWCAMQGVCTSLGIQDEGRRGFLA
jgi:hypothetical protein